MVTARQYCGDCGQRITPFRILKERARRKLDMLKHGPSDDFQSKARSLVWEYITDRLDLSDPTPEFEVFVVWFSKTLQNWKALVSSTLPDGMYYEVTYDGNKKQTYIDAYKKFENVVVRDEPPFKDHAAPSIKEYDASTDF